MPTISATFQMLAGRKGRKTPADDIPMNESGSQS